VLVFSTMLGHSSCCVVMTHKSEDELAHVRFEVFTVMNFLECDAVLLER
jgi:hypothetical protein